MDALLQGAEVLRGVGGVRIVVDHDLTVDDVAPRGNDSSGK